MWNDSRLIINDTVLQDLSVKNRWYGLTPELVSRIWQPKLQIRNLRHELPTRANAKGQGESTLLTTEPNQRFYMEKQAVVKISCAMDFSLFPFDRHSCPYVASMHLPIEELRMGPFLLDGNEIYFKAKTTTILEFATSFMELGPANQTEEMEFFTGFKIRSNIMGFKILLRRKFTSYLFNYHLPSGLFVIISWVAFVIPIEAIPGRVSVIFTTFLVLINIATSAFSNSPPSQGINYIQIWIISCIGFVSVTILEYFGLLYYARYIKQVEGRNMGSLVYPEMYGPKKSRINFKEDHVDRACLVILPILFLIFNCLYWFEAAFGRGQ
ncbi:hypothetical protein TCAL_13978 [Tigriopus californicus]|uniref:Neurotransmitter-gated ion-channel ligand-binding domain-containing protein n=2 Tax=Tigriopus californicus TaxID=6832 RepID=A0A553NNA9_TIGCA|nr:hypothetical protein TCAL_13978 [Tigriopus californicus]